MTTFNDLAPCTYISVDGDTMLAVGWLDAEQDFQCGEVGADFFEKLKSLCRDPWQPAVTAGSHQCELCQFDGPSFSGTVFVPFDGKVYVAPVGIVHYVAAHRYRPPQVFIDGVLACPPMRSVQYHKALLANGGRALVRGAQALMPPG